MLSKEVVAEIAHIAAEASIEPAALLAVVDVEAGGRAYAMIEGRNEPMIRFEGHYFDRRLNGAKRDSARLQGLASPRAGEIANPASQAARWKMLDKAVSIDRKSAYESVSWGLGQVMGAHWAWLGYASVDDLVAEARSNVAGQIRLMVRYVVKAGLTSALAAKDWEKFAQGYNGPAYHKNRYHIRLATAYRRYSGAQSESAAGPISRSSLKRGDQGLQVKDLQIALCATGYPLAIDGRFGPLTEAALKRFQRDNQLVVDGIAGLQTMTALGGKLSFGKRIRRWWIWLRSLLGL